MINPNSMVYAQERVWVAPFAPRPISAASAYDQPPSLGRKCVELFYYLSVVNSVFVYKTGAAMLPYFGGALVVMAGAVCLTIMLAQRERIPLTVWCAVLINVFATLSQGIRGEIPIIGEGLNQLFLWACQSLVICYLVRNPGTQKRLLLFFAIVLVFCVYFSGELQGGSSGRRLRLERYGVGSSFGNANDLAYMVGTFAVAVLFWSLRSIRSVRPLLWALALVLLVITVRTVSRGAITAVCCGLAMLAVAIMLARGARIGGIVMVVFGIILLSQLSFLLADPMEFLKARMKGDGSSRVRLAVYNEATLEQLAETYLFGQGIAGTKSVVTGVTPHNTYLYTQFAYGGLAAVSYLAWMLAMAIRTTRVCFRSELRMDLRLEVVALFGMTLMSHLLSNQGFVFLSSMYAVGLIEKYAVRLPRDVWVGQAGWPDRQSAGLG